MSLLADRVVSFDVETQLIAPGRAAPRLVCASVAGASGSRLLTKEQARVVFRELMRSDLVVCGANIAFDVGVMLADAEEFVGDFEELCELVFAKYERGEVFDVLIAQALDAIAEGTHGKDPRTGGPLKHPSTGKETKRYSLEVVVDLLFSRADAKANDLWRKRYGVLDLLPMEEWPESARKYPLDDADNTRQCALAQLGLIPRYGAHVWQLLTDAQHPACGQCRIALGAESSPTCSGILKIHRNLSRMIEEVRAALALHLGAIWGLRADRDRVESLARQADRAHAKYVERFREAGYVSTSEHRDKCVDETCVGCKENADVVGRAIAVAYQVDPSSRCPSCGGAGKRPSHKTGKPVNCAGRNFKGEVVCDGTGFDLATSPTLPRTPTGGVKGDRDTLKESGDEVLMAYGDDEEEKVRATYVPFLRRAVDHPLSLKPNVLVSSFRVSYEDVIQQMPRGGAARACVAAREGYLFCSCDYSGIELVTLAQSCLWIVGWSNMADLIKKHGKAGILHDYFGAAMLGMPLDEMLARRKRCGTKDEQPGDKDADDARQAAKPFNFGKGGGMGDVVFVMNQRKKNAGTTTSPDGKVKYDGIRFCIKVAKEQRCGVVKVTEWNGKPCPPICKRCLEVAHDLGQLWLATFAEMPKYLKHAEAISEGSGIIQFPIVGAIRGGAGYSDGANGYFQGLAALGMKRALWRVVTECYTVRSSPLYGSRLPFTVHDEFFAEILRQMAHAAAHRMADLMKWGMGEVVPDLAEAVEVEPALMHHWLKGADPYYVKHADGSKELRPWEESPKGREYVAKQMERMAA